MNHKCAHWVMKSPGLQLPKAPKRPESTRQHDGTVALTHSDARWCSDGFEIATPTEPGGTAEVL